MLNSGSSGNAHALRLRLSGTRIIPHIGLNLKVTLWSYLNTGFEILLWLIIKEG